MVGVFHRIVPARRLGVSRTGKAGGIADNPEGIGEALRVVFVERLILKRSLPAHRQLAVAAITYAGKYLAVEGLPSAVRVPVRGLIGQGHAVVSQKRRRAVGKLTRKRVEVGRRFADGLPAGADVFCDRDADIRPLERVPRDGRDRPVRILRVPDVVLKNLGERAARWYAVALIGVADIDVAVDGDAVPAQRVRQRVLEAAGVQIRRADRHSEPSQDESER